MKAASWFEDEDFWKAYASLMFDDGRWAEVPAAVDAILDLVGLPRRLEGRDGPLAVLDTCCGVGRHSVELAARGYRVTGIDITTAYLEAARDSAAGLEPAPEFLRADLRRFVRPGAFDLALNLFRSFGYFEDPAEDLAALRGIHTSLVPGGAFVLETLGKEVAARTFTEGEWFERDGWTVCTEYRVEGAWEGLVHRWLLMRGQEKVDRSFTLRLYSAHEIAEALKSAGFRAVEVFGSLEGAAYDEHATTMAVVARA